MHDTTTAPALPELDEGVATHLGNDILLNAAAAERPKRVRRAGSSSFQSREARAWTRGGNVD